MASMHCISCDQENSASAKFCAQCGSALNLTLCPKCEAINDRSAPRCHSCEAPLAAPTPPATRARQLTIAAAAAAGLGCTGLAYYLIDWAPPPVANVSASPLPSGAASASLLPSGPAATVAHEEPRKSARPAATAARGGVTHTRIAPVAAAPSRPPEAPVAAPAVTIENTPPVTHTRRADVATPETKTGSN